MKKQDFTTTPNHLFTTDLVRSKGLNSEDLVLSFEVDQTPQKVFEAITDVRGWWGRGVNGASRAAGDEFVYQHGDVHLSAHRLTEVVPDKKVVWLTTESRLNFVDNKNEWTGTTITFDISETSRGTAVTFTHGGLTPVLECYGACSGAWGYYVGESLRNLIETGKGGPDAE